MAATAVQPLPVGDWARNPTRTRPLSEKYRSSRHQLPSAEAWKAQAAPVRVILNHKLRRCPS